jgi:nondiscriminating aspartyl-tRNA synthetase
LQRVLVGGLAEEVGRRVTVAGWLHRQRRLGRVTFVIVRDRSGLGQAVVTDEVRTAKISQLVNETVLTVTGDVVANAQAPGGAELHNPQVDVLASPAESPPLELWRPSLEIQLPRLLEWAPLALRHLRQRGATRSPECSTRYANALAMPSQH